MVPIKKIRNAVLSKASKTISWNQEHYLYPQVGIINLLVNLRLARPRLAGLVTPDDVNRKRG
jgi:hypothetical protein